MPEASGVGVVELGEGLAPAHGPLAFDEAGRLVRALAGGLAAGGALAGALVLDVDDGQPEQLDRGVVGRVVAAGFGDLAELVVQRLAVGGVEQLADRGAEGQERGERVQAARKTRAACGYLSDRSRGGRSRS